MLNKIILALIVFLPSSIKIFVYSKFLNWEIGENVTIGICYIESEKVIIHDNVKIGNFNIFRKLKLLKIGSDSYIGNFNQFFGNSYRKSKWEKQLVLGNKVSIMSHHFMDVSGTIKIGNKTTVGGRNSNFWTHSRGNFVEGSPGLIPLDIEIGHSVYIGASVTLVGCTVPDGAVIGVGSIVNKSFKSEKQYLLIAGNPAVVKKVYETNQFVD